MTTVTPWSRARPERGSTRPHVPSGSSMAMPQPSEARSPGRELGRLDADEIEAGVALVGARGRTRVRVQEAHGKLEHGGLTHRSGTSRNDA